MELLPCPFCGSDNVEVSLSLWRVVCNSCHATGNIGESPAAAKAAWNKRVEVHSSGFVINAIGTNDGWTNVATSHYNYMKAHISDLEAENKRLRDELIQCRAENNQLEDYAADLRVCMRKARKMLKPIVRDGDLINLNVVEARQILKDGLKTK